MERQERQRAQRTRERLRTAAHRLFLRRGYLGTSVDAILAEAGVSSKETLYRYYDGKEALFVDVLNHLTMEQPEFAATLAALPAPADRSALRQALTLLARELLAMMGQPGYLPLVRMVIAEGPRFPQLGELFFATVTRRGIGLIMALLAEAHERHVIADVDLEVATYMILGRLVTSVLLNLALPDEQARPPSLARADAVVEIIMRALAP